MNHYKKIFIVFQEVLFKIIFFKFYFDRLILLDEISGKILIYLYLNLYNYLLMISCVLLFLI